MQLWKKKWQKKKCLPKTEKSKCLTFTRRSHPYATDDVRHFGDAKCAAIEKKKTWHMQYLCDWIDVSTFRIFREYRENLSFPPVILAGNNLENPSECDVFLIFVFLIFSDTEYSCYIFLISIVMLARGCNAGAAFHSNGRFDVHVCPTPQIPRKKHIHSLSILSPEKYLLKKMKQNIKKHKGTLNVKKWRT